MMKTKSLLKNVSILNLLLIAATLMAFHYYISPDLHVTDQYSPPPAKNESVDDVLSFDEYEPPSPADYTIVAEENLFHPERKIPPEKTAEQELPKPDFVVYGILWSDDISIAYLEDLKAPRSTPGRGKRQVALKKGDSLSGFTLKEIEHDRIVMVRGEESMSISVIDPEKPKHREAVASVSQTVPAQQPRTTKRTSATASQTQKAPRSPASLIKEQPSTKRRAPMTDADERIRGFFRR